MKNTLPISAMVVSHNEGFLLENCLKSIQFCDEILLIDLESKDTTLKVGKKFGCRIEVHEKVEMVEILFGKYIPKLQNDWILLIDPDEVIDDKLSIDILKFFKNIPADCGKLNVPIQYYYKNRALKGTIWGGEKSGRLIINRKACLIGNEIHTSLKMREGFLRYRIHRNGNNVDHHYWVQSFSQLLEKHKRYIKNEGEAKYLNGERYSITSKMYFTTKAFYKSFFACRGYKDGVLGLFLSCFYGWYVFASMNSLKKYEKKLKRISNGIN